MSNHEKELDALWERAAHGTHREDLHTAYDLGLAAGRQEQMEKMEKERATEFDTKLFPANGTQIIVDGDDWSDRQVVLLEDAEASVLALTTKIAAQEERLGHNGLSGIESYLDHRKVPRTLRYQSSLDEPEKDHVVSTYYRASQYMYGLEQDLAALRRPGQAAQEHQKFALPPEWHCPHCNYGEYRTHENWQQRLADHLASCDRKPADPPSRSSSSAPEESK